MITSTIIWIPKLRVNPKMNPKVDPKTMKGYAKLWRWWTLYRKCRQKRWTENSEWHSRAKDDTKNGSLTDDLQEVNNDATILVILRMTPKMIPKKIMNSLLLKQTSEMIVWGAINDCFWKEK